MGVIKSAWEIALEKTENIQSDHKAVLMHEKEEYGRKLASRILKNELSGKDLQKELKSAGKEEVSWIKQGMFDSLVSNIILPNEDVDTSTLDTIKAALGSIVKQKSQSDYIIEQLVNFIHQYVENKQQIKEHLISRFEGVIRQKEEQMSRQFGSPVKLSPEQDPDFARALAEQYRQLSDQFSQALNQGKTELKKLL